MATVRDVVCGMDVDSEKAAASEEHQGKRYYFCSTACRDQFKEDPQRYAQRG